MTPPTELQKQLELQRKSVDVDHVDITVRELIRMAADKELVMAPEYQRKFRWGEADEARLIESILLGLPVPSLFVATNADGTWEVVDGLQRISTLIHFVADPPILLDVVHKKSALRIAGLVKLTELNGKVFYDLATPVKLAFNKRSLRVTALSDKSDVLVRFDLFERLNTGGVALTPQEVRACILRGPFNDFIRELAETSTFRSLVKLQASKLHDGTREELVLKSFAYLNNRPQFYGAVGEFLTSYMSSASKSFDFVEGREAFLAATTRLASIVKGPFLRSNYANTPLNQFEAVMVALMEMHKSGTTVVDPPNGWTNDSALMNASTAGTNTAPMLKRRIERAKQLLSGPA